MTAQGPYQPLLDLATPQIYRRNPFWVLGLPPRATTKDAKLAFGSKNMRGRLGHAASTFARGRTANTRPATAGDVHVAMERLAHPAARLLDEIFWFWPTDTGTDADPAIQAWARGDADGSRALWRAQAQRVDAGLIAIHNLAVLDHLSALDTERTLTYRSDVRQAQWEDLSALWTQVFSQWRQVLDGEAFWAAVTDRTRELDDAQLTAEFVRPVRDTMALALLSINAKLAYAAAERGDGAAAKRHVLLMRDSKLGEKVVQDALAEVLSPLRSRISTAVEQAKALWGQSPQHGNRYVRHMHTQIKPLLAVVDCLLPENELGRSDLHDLVAEAIIDGETAYSTKTDDWQEGAALLAIADTTAVGEPARSKVAEKLCQDRQQIESGGHWCSPGYWDLPDVTVEALEAARRKAESSDVDGAIAALVTMDAAIGNPLRRCLSDAFRVKGVGISNAAVDEYNAESGVIKRIMDRLRGLSETELARVLSLSPDRVNPSHLKPPCLCHGGTDYTSWVSFNYRDIPLFMCRACNDLYDREVALKTDMLRSEIRDALEWILLANEMDSHDPGVAKSLNALMEIASEMDCAIPGTIGLKQRLVPRHDALLGISAGVEMPAVKAGCHFCAKNSPDDACAITVRMSGGVHEVALMFGSQTNFNYVDVVVPRCQRCRDQHAHLPKLMAQWERAREASAAGEQFPEILSDLAAAGATVRACDDRVEAAYRAVAKLKSRLTQRAAVVVVALTMLGGIIGLLRLIPDALAIGAVRIEEMSGWNADEATQYLPFAIAGLVVPLFAWGFGTKLNRGLAQRRKDTDGALATAVAERKSAVFAFETTKAKMDAAKADAIASYPLSCATPELPADVAAEAAYVEYAGIKKRQADGWAIGVLEGTAKSFIGRKTSGHVRGLVA